MVRPRGQYTTQYPVLLTGERHQRRGQLLILSTAAPVDAVAAAAGRSIEGARSGRCAATRLLLEDLGGRQHLIPDVVPRVPAHACARRDVGADGRGVGGRRGRAGRGGRPVVVWPAWRTTLRVGVLAGDAGGPRGSRLLHQGTSSDVRASEVDKLGCWRWKWGWRPGALLLRQHAGVGLLDPGAEAVGARPRVEKQSVLSDQRLGHGHCSTGLLPGTRSGRAPWTGTACPANPAAGWARPATGSLTAARRGAWAWGFGPRRQAEKRNDSHGCWRRGGCESDESGPGDCEAALPC